MSAVHSSVHSSVRLLQAISNVAFYGGVVWPLSYMFTTQLVLPWVRQQTVEPLKQAPDWAINVAVYVLVSLLYVLKEHTLSTSLTVRLHKQA